MDDVIDARACLLRALRRSANFIQSLLLLVLFNMLEFLSDFDDVDDDFEYDGRPYRFEPEYTDEDLLERKMQKQREEQLAREQQTAARL